MSVSTSPTPEQLQELAKTASAYPANKFSPQALVRAIAIRAASLGVTEEQTRVFLVKHIGARPGLAPFLKQAACSRLLKGASKAAAFSSSQGAAASARKVARLTVGRVLSEIKGTPKRRAGADDDPDESVPVTARKPPSPAVQLRARVAMAVMAVELLESINGPRHWNTISLPHGLLAVRTGWSVSTARNAVRDVATLRLAKELPTGRAAVAKRWKISGLLNVEQGAVAAGQYGTIGRLMGRTGAESLAAEIILSVTHPAWNYGPTPLGHRAWLTAVADAAGIDPTTLAISKRNISLDRKALRAAGLGDVKNAAELHAALDAYAVENGCVEARAKAEEAYREQAAARTAEVKLHQGLKADAIAALDAFTGPAMKIPKLDTSRGRKFAAWLATSTEAFDGRSYPAEMATATATELARRIGKRLGGNRAAAGVVASWILSGLSVNEVSARGLAAMKAARGLEHLCGGLLDIPAGDAPELVQRVWLKELQGRLAAGKPMAPDMREAVTADLQARLFVRGYSVEKASKASAWCVRDVAIVRAAAA
ncbi:hypothetical protein B5P43_15570 [Bacillus sp. SRB_336]|nr:hypothetical protein B5P43_15570 [Bacillus sp. SRB_336]